MVWKVDSMIYNTWPKSCLKKYYSLWLLWEAAGEGGQQVFFLKSRDNLAAAP